MQFVNPVQMMSALFSGALSLCGYCWCPASGLIIAIILAGSRCSV